MCPGPGGAHGTFSTHSNASSSFTHTQSHSHIMFQPTQLTLTHWQAASCRPLLLLHHFGQLDVLFHVLIPSACASTQLLLTQAR